MKLPSTLLRLVDELAELPGIGTRTAQRLAFALLQRPQHQALALAKAIEDVKHSIRFCDNCHGFAEDSLCLICNDERRLNGQVCIVEQPQDIFAIENTAVFNGQYHVLRGVLSPIDGIGPDELTLKSLIEKLERGNFNEVVIATNPSTNGEATALHIKSILSSSIKVTKLARGMPIGAHLELTDGITIEQAFLGRQNVD